MKNWIKRAGISFFISIIFLFASCVSVFSYLHVVHAFHQEMCLGTILLIVVICTYLILLFFYILAIKEIWIGYDKERKKQIDMGFKS